MKKLLTLVSVALLGATLGFACGGGQKAASTMPTDPAKTTEPASVEGTGGGEAVGGDAYGGDAYGGDAYGGGESW